MFHRNNFFAFVEGLLLNTPFLFPTLAVAYRNSGLADSRTALTMSCSQPNNVSGGRAITGPNWVREKMD